MAVLLGEDPIPVRPRVLVVLVILLGSLAIGVPVRAQSATDERDQVREDREQAEGALDVLQASDAELEDEVARLQKQVRSQEAAKRDAERAVEAAQAEVRAAEAQVTQARDEIVELRSEAELRAIEAYINPETDGENGEIVAAENLAEAARRQAFLSTVSARKTDVLDRIRATEEDMVTAEGEAVEARAREQNERNRVARLLAGYRASLVEQQEAQAALEARIADFEAEVDALAAEDARLTALIKEQASQAPVVPQGEAPAANAVETPAGPVNPPSSASGLIWPSAGSVTSEYGPRWGRLHAGIDIAAATGTPIYAAQSGRVIGGCGSGYGNCILIDHGGGLVTLYGHMTSVFVSGGSVSRGQNVGTMGCTGSCTGPHLHFETRVNGIALNPRNYLP
jgi:murein DD-endopeptidase MepM/ murein hydrolase activator NlpD